MTNFFDIGQKVQIVDSKHSGVTVGSVGVVESVVNGDGYGVWLPNVTHTAFIYDKTIEDSVVFFREEEIKDYIKNEEKPMSNRIKPTEEQKIILLRAMMINALSLTRAAEILFKCSDAISEVRAEYMLDSMWGQGLCICLGESYNYTYVLTEKGRVRLSQ